MSLLRHLKSLFADSNERQLAPYRARVSAINAMADKLAALDDDALRSRIADFRQRRDNGETAQSMQNEVFAVVREGAARTLKMRHFDEQLLGGMALFDGLIAEMKTGEGKTLVATLPICLEAMSGKGAHVVTVNDYLAQRDAEWMGQLYRFLGFTVGVNTGGVPLAEKAAAYACDITYGTNNEFGFDYLRHNMRYSAAEGVQRPLNYAIIDEVDSILIDEARTPLIISGEANDTGDLYRAMAVIAKAFKPGQDAEENGDFTLDEKSRTVHLTEAGFERAEKLFSREGLTKAGDSLYAPGNLPLLHHLDVALRARHLFTRDRDYVVQDGQVIIVDEFTGRLMPGRRWGDNQHQAVEAKEGVGIQKENQTLASTSFQNYFRLYNRISGMTGTASTEAEEFNFIYGLRVIKIPTHQSMIRRDELDKVYRTAAAKTRAILHDIQESVAGGQPVLVGTTSIQESERLSGLLTDQGVAHSVLNAKQHASEARIISQAGVPGTVTLSTNMAGRGTDIILGGNIDEERQAIESDESLTADDKAARSERLAAEWQKRHAAVVEAGGLRVIGTERHESRRIDNQLRGRSGRQGDPGSSIFYLSFEDSLLRIFATRHVSALMEKMQMEEDEAIEAKLVSRTIENAQRKVEAHNFDIRRQLLEYDDTANEQRKMIYEQREEILTTTDIADVAHQFRTDHLESLFDEYLPEESPEEEWRVDELERLLKTEYGIDNSLSQWIKENETARREYFIERTKETAEAQFSEKFSVIESDRGEQFMRTLILNIIDEHWRGHISALDSLRLSIGFRGMAQKNPKQEYKRESFEMFNRLLHTIQMTVARVFYALRIRQEAPPPPPPPPSEGESLQYSHPAPSPAAEKPDEATAKPPPPAPSPAATPVAKKARKIRRNDPCPCNSGKKYKHCCGKI